MKRTWILCGSFILLLLAGGVALSDEGHKDPEPADDFLKGASWENGELIYTKGANRSGYRIPFQGGPHWLYMHGGGCVSCHGKTGQGGVVPQMCRIKSEAITYKALTSEDHEHRAASGSKEEEHAPYTIADIRKAVETGVNPAGKPLDPCMPHWKFTDKDFKDLLAYLARLDDLAGGH